MAKDKNKRSALILGATGLVGRFCLDYLLKDDTYNRVTAITRSPLNHSHGKLNTHILNNFEEMEKLSDFFRVDDLFCCLGIKMESPNKRIYLVDYIYPTLAAGIAASQGVEKYILISAAGAGPRNPNFVFRNKYKTEQVISGESFKEVHLLRPLFIEGKRDEFRFERIPAFFFNSILRPVKKHFYIPAEAVAFSMVQLATSTCPGVHIHRNKKLREIYFKDR